MTMDENRKPKVFISYSWSSEYHKTWVREFAEALEDHGVNVVLDVWEIKLGSDISLYAEKMVSDETIDKVLIICDKEYVRKANSRDNSGVGRETRIISEEIYREENQNKFIPVILEYDDNGEHCCPIYCKNVYFADMRDDRFLIGFEELLGGIYDKTLYPK